MVQEKGGRWKLKKDYFPSLCQVMTQRRCSCASAKILPAGNERSVDVEMSLFLVFLLPSCHPVCQGWVVKASFISLQVIITCHS